MRWYILPRKRTWKAYMRFGMESCTIRRGPLHRDSPQAALCILYRMALDLAPGKTAHYPTASPEAWGVRASPNPVPFVGQMEIEP